MSCAPSAAALLEPDMRSCDMMKCGQQLTHYSIQANSMPTFSCSMHGCTSADDMMHSVRAVNDTAAAMLQVKDLLLAIREAACVPP